MPLMTRFAVPVPRLPGVTMIDWPSRFGFFVTTHLLHEDPETRWDDILVLAVAKLKLMDVLPPFC